MRSLDLGPLIEKNTQIAHKISGALTFAHRADDHPDPFGNIQFAQNLAQPLALFGSLDLSRDTAAIAERHQHQISAGKTQIGRDARPLGADRAFGDLHDHLRADRVNAWDVFHGDSFSVACSSGPIDFLDPAVERGGNGVPKMKERVFFEADVDEHRLQPHLDVLDSALVDAADDVARAVTLDAVFFKPTVLEQRHARSRVSPR